ncbi:hypothetical protein [Nocardioides sp.]|uniref:hypothetical protein n=1 Tax=Nocardioides sp. TaxID=35761 RepID=UPI003D0FFACD
MRRVQLVVVSLLVGATLAGCGNGASVEKGGNGAVLLVAGEDVETPTDQVSGVVLMVGDCVGLHEEGAADPSVAVWVHGTTITKDEIPVLTLPVGDQLAVGDSFTGGGTHFDRADLPDSFPEIPTGCPGEDIVFAYPMNAASAPVADALGLAE